MLRMQAKRRAWWLLVPAAGVVGAFLLPTPDEFEFLRGGTPVPVEGFRETRDDWRGVYPLPGAHGRAWTFRVRADDVEKTLKQRLSSESGWVMNGIGEMYERAGPRKGQVGRKSWVYVNQDTGGVAVFVRYLRPDAGPTCAVIVREPRNAWGRIKHLGRRMVAR